MREVHATYMYYTMRIGALTKIKFNIYVLLYKTYALQIGKSIIFSNPRGERGKNNKTRSKRSAAAVVVRLVRLKLVEPIQVAIGRNVLLSTTHYGRCYRI